MKKLYTIIFATLAVFFSQQINAQTFSWSGYTTGATSYNASNSGVTMTVAQTGTGSVSGFPSYVSGNGGYLNIGADWSNRTSNLTVTFTFSKPITGVLFLLYDVDQGGTWDDKVTISGTNSVNSTVYPMITASSYSAVSGANNNILEGKADNANYTNSPATVSFGAALIKSFSITYSAGSSSPSNPLAQYIGIGTITFGSVLPVHLVSFKAEKRSGNAFLQWETDNMINFSHFEVERSTTSGTAFEKIAVMATNGQDAGIYNYTDLNVQARIKTAFYRVKMVDVDGKFQYTPVVMLNFDGGTMVDVRPTLLRTGEMIRITISDNNQARYDVKLFDLSGKLIMQQNQVNGQVQLQTANLQKGMYIVHVTDGTTPRSFRVTVQ